MWGLLEEHISHADVSEIVAFGDDYADISMLKICGIGVAMGNAVQEVKDIVDDITLSNEEDGAVAYLEKWIIWSIHMNRQNISYCKK